MIGLPLIPCTMPPVVSISLSSVTRSRKFFVLPEEPYICSISISYSAGVSPETVVSMVAAPVVSSPFFATGIGSRAAAGSLSNLPKTPYSVFDHSVPRRTVPKSPRSSPGLFLSLFTTEVTFTSTTVPLAMGIKMPVVDS